MSMGRKQKRGFTLVETVVTVGIVAALAAVVYPTVVRQFDTADPTKAAEDLNSIATALDAFGVNVRPNQPRELDQLVNPIGVGSASFHNAQDIAYSLADSSNWRGPYLALSIPTATATTATATSTGFGAAILNGLIPFQTSGTTTLTGGDDISGGTAPFAAADYLAVKITGLTIPAFNAINTLIDGPNEAVGAQPDEQRQSLGRLRCPYTGTTENTTTCPAAYFLASPFRH